MNLRQITTKDQLNLMRIYFDSILSINENIYDQDQKRAWCSQVWDNINFKKSINKGKGWLIYERKKTFAFATRYPDNRISLLYCIGKSQRKGFGTKLICQLEDDAKKQGLYFLKTEASLISYKLFLKLNWEIIRKEKIIIKNKFFERYKMVKNF